MSCQYLATGEYTCDNQSMQEEVKRMVINTSEVKPEKFTNSCTQCNIVENFTNNTHQPVIYHSNGNITTK